MRSISLALVIALVATASTAGSLRSSTTPRDVRVPSGDVANVNCVTLNSSNTVVPGRPGVAVWKRMNCSMDTQYGHIGPIVINTLVVDLTAKGIFLTPLTGGPRTNTSTGLGPLPKIMARDSRLVAGVNGGYFYRADVPNFFDDVCIGKTLQDAILPVNVSSPNNGIGDGIIVINGTLIAMNCNPKYGYNDPVTLVLDGPRTYIDQQKQASPPPPGAVNAIAAGPNMVSWNATSGQPYVDVPAGDQNLNKLEHGAQTSVGLRGQPGNFTEMVMVTVDGVDSCMPWVPTCGLNVYPFAVMMKSWLNVSVAMSMDQGGSTTMVIKGQAPARDGVVSCASVPDCSDTGRMLYSGLFLGVE